MPARRSWRLDLAACAWLAAGLLVTLCVVVTIPPDTPHPALSPRGRGLSETDAPRAAVAPSGRGLGEGANLLGPAGAGLAHVLHQTFGSAVFVVLFDAFLLAAALFMRRKLLPWGFRLAGWVLLVPATATLAQRFGNSVRTPAIPISGGTLGNWLSAMMDIQFPEDAWPMVMSVLIAVALTLALGEILVFPLRATVFVLRAVFGFAPTAPDDYLAAEGSSWSPASSREQREPTRLKLKPRPTQPSASVATAGIAKDAGSSDDAADAAEPVIIPIRRPDQMPEPTPQESAHHAESPPASRLSLLSFLRPQPAPAKPPTEPEEDFELPSLTLLEEAQPFPYEQHEQQLRDLAALLEKTFADFELNVRVVGINTGPVVTQFEIALETGLRVHKVTRLADDLALNLKVPSVRVVAPIPGKNTVGIEVPNEFRASVRLKEVIRTAGTLVAKAKIPLFLGKDTEGKPLVHDLADMPHLLIAGRTGTGKSVCMNSIILSILMTRRPDEVKMVMIDPKMLELSEYGRIPHLMHPVVKDMKKAEAILSWAVDKMEERYDVLSRARVRSIAGYNELAPAEIHRRLGFDELTEEDRSRIPDRMPYIVIFVDEMNDLMMTMKKEVEGHIIRLAQKSRAAGIHLVVATQKPTVDVITGLIKSNLPARICFQVSSRSDSRVVLDEMGAEKLLGKGDMLFLIPGTSTIVRAQGTYASDAEIAGVVKHLECEPRYVQELIQIGAAGDKEGGGSLMERLRARDELYESAIEIVIREGRGSVSLLQRALGIGYGRAARLVDFMAEDGIVGDYNGSQAREVLYTPEQWEALREKNAVGAE